MLWSNYIYYTSRVERSYKSTLEMQWCCCCGFWMFALFVLCSDCDSLVFEWRVVPNICTSSFFPSSSMNQQKTIRLCISTGATALYSMPLALFVCVLSIPVHVSVHTLWDWQALNDNPYRSRWTTFTCRMSTIFICIPWNLRRFYATAFECVECRCMNVCILCLWEICGMMTESPVPFKRFLFVVVFIVYWIYIYTIWFFIRWQFSSRILTQTYTHPLYTVLVFHSRCRHYQLLFMS